MSTPSLRFCAATLIGALLSPAIADAHGIVGDRFFPATIASDDPFAADELALPTIAAFNHEIDFDFDYSKSIFPGFAVGVGSGYVDATPSHSPSATGFSNVDISPTLELYRDPEHEAIVSVGLDWAIGGTGSKAVADPASTYTPTIKYGKGFGDLPDSMAYLRPFAVTGTVGYAIPGTRAISRSVEWAGALEYSLLYLQNNVRDQGLTGFVLHLTPIVEYSFSSPLDAGGDTTGTLNPGLVWSGQYEQVAMEAIVPVNTASGNSVGVIAQLHFYLDDIFPDTLGKPLFGGER